jgi:hypothetical protein
MVSCIRAELPGPSIAKLYEIERGCQSFDPEARRAIRLKERT